MKTKQNLSEQQEANFKLFQGFLLSFKNLVERYKEAFKYLDLNNWSNVKEFINVGHFLLTEFYFLYNGKVISPYRTNLNYSMPVAFCHDRFFENKKISEPIFLQVTDIGVKLFQMKQEITEILHEQFLKQAKANGFEAETVLKRMIKENPFVLSITSRKTKEKHLFDENFRTNISDIKFVEDWLNRFCPRPPQKRKQDPPKQKIIEQEPPKQKKAKARGV